MINLNQDINIVSLGGCGSMILLHYLLLYKKHYANFHLERSHQIFYNVPSKFKYIDDKKKYDSLKGDDWPNYEDYRKYGTEELAYRLAFEIEGYEQTHQNDDFYNYFLKNYLPLVIDYTWKGDKHNWKKYETFLNNSATQKEKILNYNKIFCSLYSPTVNTWEFYPGLKILLYTDYKSQRRLAMHKRAFYFHPNSMATYNFSSIRKSFRKQKLVTFDGITIDEMFADIWPIVDVKINLIDFINNPNLIFSELPNKEQVDLLKKWRSLHPDKLLTKISINRN